MLHPRVRPRPDWEFCIVAASGPSLTPGVAEACRGYRSIAVNDAYRLLPFADVLYSCDAKWWRHVKPEFCGERWSSYHPQGTSNWSPGTLDEAETFGLQLVNGRRTGGNDPFSFDPEFIHYGDNSGFQAINLALLFGARVIALVGFNMQPVGDKTHWFGRRKGGELSTGDYLGWLRHFEAAAKELPAHIRIVNCTPDSALTCFPKGTPDDFATLARLGQADDLPAVCGGG